MNNKTEKLDIIPTLNFGEDWLSNEQIISDILEQHKDGGYTKFIIWYPSTGIVSDEFPSLEDFIEAAKRFKIIKDEVAKQGVSLGWWIRNTVNVGIGDEFQKIVKADGSSPPYSKCPLCPNLQKRVSEAMAAFAKVGRPDFIFMEDDFSVAASSGGMGCFCEAHLKEFSRREGKNYTREQLTAALKDDSPEGMALLRRWRELTTDSLVEFATAIRKEIDRETPEISIGHMQPGNCDCDGGDSTYRVSKALAGERHTPYSRIFSCLYSYKCDKDLPLALFNAQYRIENIKENFKFIHETDPYPHTRFYTATGAIKACMSAVYTMGYDGSTFNNAQFCDNQNEERVLDRMFKAEHPRFEEAHRIAKQCKITGVGVEYDPFYNGFGPGNRRTPLWVPALSKFGIPITTADSDVMFWDLMQAKYKNDVQIKSALSNGLFLDGEAAKCLCERGYGEYLGINISEPLCENAYFKTGNPNSAPISFDLGAREIICEKFAREGEGRNMTSPFMYAPKGYGNLMKMTVTNPKTETLVEFYDHKRRLITPSMTRFQNSLGGRVVVMGITLFGNFSHSLINYRRKRLIEDQIKWCGGNTVIVEEAPDVYALMTEAINPVTSGFKGMVTLNNLCPDTLDEVTLYIPEKWRGSEFFTLEQNGEWRSLNCEAKGEKLFIKEELKLLEPMYILVK